MLAAIMSLVLKLFLTLGNPQDPWGLWDPLGSLESLRVLGVHDGFTRVVGPTRPIAFLICLQSPWSKPFRGSYYMTKNVLTTLILDPRVSLAQ